jgi:hypothetical protein
MVQWQAPDATCTLTVLTDPNEAVVHAVQRDRRDLVLDLFEKPFVSRVDRRTLVPSLVN